MSRPLVAVLMSYTVGIMTGYFFHVPYVILIVSGTCALLIGYYNELKAWRKNRLYFCIAVILFSMIMCQWQEERNKGNLDSLAGKQVVFTGTVSEEPDARFNGTNYTVKIEEVSIPEGHGEEYPDKPQGSILVTVRGPGPQYSYGDRLRVSGTPEFPKEPGNPGEFNYKSYLQAKGIRLVVKSWQGAGVRKTGTGSINPLVDICLKFKQKLMSVVRATMSERHTGLMGGILFGTTGLIDAQSRNDFALSGVVHILSVSGYHVALLAAFCLFLGNALKLNRVGVSVLTVLITAFYTVMSGAGPPAVRAMIMAWVLLLAHYLERDYDWPSSLSLAALIILLFNPRVLFNAGFQLSFVATWGILYLVPLLRRFAGFYLANSDVPAILSNVGQAVAITIAAQLAVLPITSYYFNYFSVVAVPANLVIVPLISLVMLLGGVAAVFGAVWLPVAEILNVSTGLVLDLVLSLAHFSAGLPFAVVTVKQPSFVEIAGFYGVLVVLVETVSKPKIFLRVRRVCSLHKPKLVLAVMSAAVVLLWTGIVYSGQGKLQVTFLDIGQGDAMLIESPGGRNIVLDTGGVQNTGRSTYNPGEKVLLPFLRRKGVSRIDLLLLSHAHADHIQGAEALVNNMPVDMLVVNRQFYDKPEGARLVSLFRAKGTQIREITGGDRITVDENVVMETLSPRNGTVGGENNDSLVMRLCYGEFQIVFTGDAEEPVLQELTGLQTAVDAEIVKVPHHGSRNAWSEQFYRAVNPQLAVISVGPNYFGHPSKEVLEGFARLGIPVYRTDTFGAVIVQSDGQTYRVETGKKAKF
ncbi:MAG: DNA internalization-related competence protein ComEC/Rec2 [Eubacteriales bacterium]